jgi:tellurite resistance protein TerB
MGGVVLATLSRRQSFAARSPPPTQRSATACRGRLSEAQEPHYTGSISNLFEAAREAIAREIERFRNRHFLEATMAASALVACADGEVKISELNTLDQALDAIHELEIFDPHVAVDLYRDHAEALRRGEKDARRNALKAVAEIRGNESAALLLLKVCVAIGKSDEAFDDAEREVVLDICAALDIAPAKAGL